MARVSTVLMLLVVVLSLGCVDTAQPTGPAPTPPEDGGGELVPEAATVSEIAAAEGARARARSRTPAAGHR